MWSNENIVDCEYPPIRFLGKVFCFTGEFILMDRSALETVVAQVGGIVKNGLTLSTDYLVVGSAPSEAWIGGSYGTKIKKALRMKKDRKPLVILSEESLMNTLSSLRPEQPQKQSRLAVLLKDYLRNLLSVVDITEDELAEYMSQVRQRHYPSLDVIEYGDLFYICNNIIEDIKSGQGVSFRCLLAGSSYSAWSPLYEMLDKYDCKRVGIFSDIDFVIKGRDAGVLIDIATRKNIPIIGSYKLENIVKFIETMKEQKPRKESCIYKIY